MSSPQQPLPPSAIYNARLGAILFIIYLIIYATFVGLSAYKHDLMQAPVLGGANVAIVYGFALIVLAFVLAVVYMALCRSDKEGGN